MTDSIVELPIADDSVADEPKVQRPSVWRNVLRYVAKRLGLLALTVASAVYLTILIANYGGYIDVIVEGQIAENAGFLARNEPYSSMPAEERAEAIEAARLAMEEAAGLNDPFLLRTVRWLDQGLTLDWGQPTRWRSYGMSGGAVTVGEVILDNLARTLLVFGVANLFLFGASVLLGLFLNRRRGGRLDRLFVLLSPISSAPAWVYGVLLSTFFLRVFGFSPGGTFDSWEGELQLSHLLIIGRHLLLPFLAIFLAGLFQTVYTWRSFFQVYSNEDYVEMARAKGLPSRRVDRDYIVRPALPALLTRFGLLLALLWQEVIALEYFFNVQGLGRLFFDALQANDTPMIVAIVTVFAYLVAVTVFLLDIAYMLVDPRVRVSGQERQGKLKRTANGPLARLRRFRAGRKETKRRARTMRRVGLSLPRPTLAGMWAGARRTVARIGETLLALRRYPSAVVGLVIIAFLVGVSVYAVVTIPYEEAVSLWRGEGNVWVRHPRSAAPAWVNLFRSDDLPPTMALDSRTGGVEKETVALEGGLTDVIMPFTFDYEYGGFPQEIIVDLEAPYEERGPHVTLTWVWPDGREQELTSFKPKTRHSYYLSQDERLQRRLDSERPREALFLEAEGQGETAVEGTYTLRVQALLFEPDTDVEANVTMIGQVHGLAGTDEQRRDMMVALLWGAPVALGFGIIAAFATSVGGMLLAAAGAWYGGVVDRVVQYLTEVNLILPFFPVSLMVFIMYSKSIVTILAVTVALTIFGSAVKTYRAMFLQVRTEPYIEAARAYGASDLRIILRYMAPRIMTLLIPRLIILVPTYVFLEATLAFLGVSDPLLPTWGKLVVGALSYGVHTGATHLVLAPLGVLFVTGFAFAMVGLALERVFEPRLRDI